MKADQLIEFLQNPGALDASSLPQLESWLKEYPFFQTVHMLRLKNLQNIQPKLDQQELHYTAAYVSDRKMLYYLLHAPVLESVEDEPQEEAVPPVEMQRERDYKESLQENISDAVTQQYHSFTDGTDEQKDLTPGLAINIRKEYGSADEPEAAPVIQVAGKKSIDDMDLLELDDETILPLEEESGIIVTDEESFELEDGEAIHAEFTREKEIQSKEQDVHQVDTMREVRAEIPYDLNALYGDGASDANDNASLIDQFIKTNPKISNSPEATSDHDDISEDSVKEHESFFTDTLAQIYMKQGNYTKAILAYEKLSLKYPEKSTYFAGQISEIKKLIHKS